LQDTVKQEMIGVQHTWWAKRQRS